MKVNIKFTGITPDEAIRTYAEEKFASFSKVLGARAYDAAVCDVELSCDAHHQSGDVYYAEITLEETGRVHRVSENEPAIEKAIDKGKDDMLEQLRADKGRAETQFLKGAREAKEIIQDIS